MIAKKKQLTTLYWLRKGRAVLGKSPMFCRVTISGQRYEIPLNLSIDPKIWDAKLQLCTGRSPEAKRANLIINQLSDIIQKTADRLQAKG